MWIEMMIVVMLGLSFGSLNTLLSHRLPRDEAVFMTRSRCPNCKTALSPSQLVPLFSWLWSRGACAHCGASIHWRYPLTEIVCALLFLLCWSLYGFSLQALLIALLGSQIVVLCIIDYNHRIIPDSLQVTMAITGVMYGLLMQVHLADMIAGMLAGGLVGLILQRGYRLYKKSEGLGTGDVKFMCVAGIWLGAPALLPFFFYSGVLGVISALLWRWLKNDPYFPFGPALAVSLFVMVLHPEAVHWYTDMSLFFVSLFIPS